MREKNLGVSNPNTHSHVLLSSAFLTVYNQHSPIITIGMLILNKPMTTCSIFKFNDSQP